jgi:hypothetical protein
MVVFVQRGDVVKDIFLLLVHAPQPVLNDHRQLVGESGIVGHAIGNELSENLAVAVLMLQALAGQGGAPGSAADQEAPRLQYRPPPRPDRRCAGSRTSSSR